MAHRRVVQVAATAAAAVTTLSMSGTALAAKSHKPKPEKPAVRDSDHDGMPDKWERANGLNPRRDDAKADPDGDKLNNLREYRAGTKAHKADTDRDGMPDGWEVDNRLNPRRDDSDDDSDHDGLSNGDEYDDGDNPRNRDSDRDGKPDAEDNAGAVASFDTTTGALTVRTVAGTTVTVTVTDDTELSWVRRSIACHTPPTVDDLTVGRVIHKIKTEHGHHRGDHGAHRDDDSARVAGDEAGNSDAPAAEKIKLVCGGQPAPDPDSNDG